MNCAQQSFVLPVENTTVRQMVNFFLSCQRCMKVSTRPKQLKCSHTMCTACVLSTRKRNVEAGAWMLECAVCGRMNIWQDENGELSGLEDNILMQQMMKQMAGQNKIFTEQTVGMESLASMDYPAMNCENNMTVNIVSAVKEKIEIQEALQYAEKKMYKCQQQTRYIKSYEKRINAAKSSLAQKISRSAEILIATVIQEQSRLLKNLDEMFHEDLQPVVQARENLQKQMQSLELVTRCCDVATRMLREGRTPLDMASFKEMIQKSTKNSKKFSLPDAVKQRYKTKVVFSCDESGFEDMVRNFAELKVKNVAEKTEKCPIDDMPEQIYDMPELGNDIDNEETQPVYDLPPPIYDLPPEGNAFEQYANQFENREVLYEEIPFRGSNFQYSCKGLPSSDSDPASPLTPPPRPPKNFATNENSKGLRMENATAKLIENRRQAMNESESFSDAESTDSFSSDSEPEDGAWEHSPALPPRTLSLARKDSGKIAKPMRHQPGSPNMQLHGTVDRRTRPTLSRALSVRSATSSSSASPPGRRKSDKLLFRIGRLRKPGSRETQVFQTPPEIATGPDGVIWISDASGHKVQAHEGTCGNLVTSFKTTLNGITLKPKGIAVFEHGRMVATTCGKCIVVWDKRGNFVRKYGPNSELGKITGVAADASGRIVMGDAENLQIAIEDAQVKITAIGRAAGSAKSTWPGRLAVNRRNQIVTADYTEHCVKIFNMDGSLVTKFGSFGTEEGQMRYPSAVAVDSHDRIYVADECNNRISVYSPDGKTFFGDALTKQDGLNFPHAVAVLSNGSIAVSDDSKLVKVYAGMGAWKRPETAR